MPGGRKARLHVLAVLYLTLAHARSDVFDHIERFHNPRMQRRLDGKDQAIRHLTQQSVETG